MKNLLENEYLKLKKDVEAFSEIEKRYFRHLTIKYCTINGKPLSEYKLVHILGHDETSTMTIICDLDNRFEEINRLIEKVKDHTNWEINETHYIEQEKKYETKMKEHEQEIEKMENVLKKLSRIELLYFRDLLKNEYSIFAMGYEIDEIIYTIDMVGAKFEEIDILLENITDHTKWKISESEYIKDIENGILDDINC
jgi:hypothetical protein